MQSVDTIMDPLRGSYCHRARTQANDLVQGPFGPNHRDRFVAERPHHGLVRTFLAGRVADEKRQSRSNNQGSALKIPSRQLGCVIRAQTGEEKQSLVFRTASACGGGSA